MATMVGFFKYLFFIQFHRCFLYNSYFVTLVDFDFIVVDFNFTMVDFNFTMVDLKIIVVDFFIISILLFLFPL